MVPSHDDDANQTPDLLDLNVPRGRLSNRRDDWVAARVFDPRSALRRFQPAPRPW
jgi:hypothetical protein